MGKQNRRPNKVICGFCTQFNIKNYAAIGVAVCYQIERDPKGDPVARQVVYNDKRAEQCISYRKSPNPPEADDCFRKSAGMKR